MSMNNLVQALEIANDCARAKKLMGMNTVYPYKPEQFVDALLSLREKIQEQLTTIKTLEAQLRAANARVAKAAGKDVL
jgi:hypothetical protein